MEKEIKAECSSASSDVGLVDMICMGMTFNMPAHKPSRSRPKMQIVSHARIRTVSFSNIKSSPPSQSKFGEAPNHTVSGSTITKALLACLTI